MNNDAIRLGVIYPGGGGEYEYYQMTESRSDGATLYLVTSRLWGEDNDHDIQALLKTGDVKELAFAGKKLGKLMPTSAIWACTSGSFVGGVSMAKEQIRAISEATRCPASTTSSAFIHAAQALGVRKVSVVATYPKSITERFLTFLDQMEIEVIHHVSLDQSSGWDAAGISMHDLFDTVCKTDSPRTDAVLIPDTAIAAIDIIEPLELKLDKPVLTANQVTFWELLKLARQEIKLEGFGRLFWEGA